MLSKFKENRKKIVVVFVCLMAVIIAVTVGVIVYRNSDKVKVKNYLEMGSRYLSEMQYEQAIVEFTKAFELDPDNPVVTGNLVTAYSDWADALVEEENYDKAIEILTQG
nr:tetratricopeptide repeat protein [Lachnospiraceae bacterium]